MLDVICEKLGFVAQGVNWSHITLLSWGYDCTFSRALLVIFVIFWLAFFSTSSVGNMKHVAVRLKYNPEVGPICLIPGPNSIKFSTADQMGFSLLTNLTKSRGSILLRKIGWNYPSGALCLISVFYKIGLMKLVIDSSSKNCENTDWLYIIEYS